MSESYADHHTIDGDIFDDVTDVTLIAFPAAAEQGCADCGEVWSSWLVREGHETYAYLTVDELLTVFAANSVDADCRNQTVLMPIQGGRHASFGGSPQLTSVQLPYRESGLTVGDGLGNVRPGKVGEVCRIVFRNSYPWSA